MVDLTARGWARRLVTVIPRLVQVNQQEKHNANLQAECLLPELNPSFS